MYRHYQEYHIYVNNAEENMRTGNNNEKVMLASKIISKVRNKKKVLATSKEVNKKQYICIYKSFESNFLTLVLMT